ncbi:MAG: hypothetical protein K9N46_13190 [Candidatus Marinimicrobia bacterium]|nr:hypothetical protein [Candidatus Neomarinimicrobiota bacterium]MCF7829737.1 hypothetical protein [Candidatus Neomarinimicrobiota bacterium]MCF7881687.1 hypothetical protein [Candidatus Neomarinimicrobiota bacterium]
MNRTGVPAIIVLISLISHCASKDQIHPGRYPTPEPEGEHAELFAPGIISTGMYERDLAMTPDGEEIYFSVVLARNNYTAIMVTKRMKDGWAEPEVTSFSSNPEWWDLEPCISPDGQRFFFMSNRPDTASGDTTAGDEDIWVMERKDGGWGMPQNLGEPVNSEAEEYFPSITTDGTLYFTRQEPESPVGFIMRSRLKDGEYQEPVRLPSHVNSGQSRYNAFIAPDESYLILPIYGRDDSYGATDYYICFRDTADNWTEPVNLGPQVNSGAPGEYSPYVSPDGVYLFFMSDRLPAAGQQPTQLSRRFFEQMHRSPQNGNPDIYWIKTAVWEDLKTGLRE